MNKIVYKIKETVFIWVYYWSMLLESLIGILSFTLIRKHIALDVAKKLARWRYEQDPKQYW